MDDFYAFFFWFLFYSLIGWFIEGFFNLFTKGTFIKNNFLRYPIKPMYGISSALIIFIKPLIPLNLFLFIAFVLPTFIEYMTAYLLFHFFCLRYWDYSQCACHISGYICLRFSIYWFLLSLLLVYIIHPYLAPLYDQMGYFWLFMFPICLFIFVLDTGLTFYQKRHSML